jgi:MFS family permease
MRPYAVFVSLAATFGGFVWAFDATVISGVVPFLKQYFGLNGTQGDLKLGLGVSCLGWGVLGGTAISGLLSGRFGRKRILIVTAALLGVSAWMSALATSFPVFVASRVLGGIGVGGTILVAPAYIAEVSPSNSRASLGSLNQLMIVTGISASFFSNRFLLDAGQNNWRWMLGVGAIPAAAYFLLLFGVPESPRWLLGKGQEEKAREVLGRICGKQEGEAELRRIRESLAKGPAGHGLGGLLGRKMRWVIWIGVAIAFFQQITGISAVFYYLPSIFVQAGGSLDSAFWQAAVVGLVNLGMTLVALWLMDRIGRKPLLIIGVAGMAAAALTCSWAFDSATYQLTAKSYEMLQAGKVPPDFMADLKSAEGHVFATDKEFVADMEKRFGADQIKPYRDALAAAALNIRATVVFWAIIGFVASFAFSLGPAMGVLLTEIFPQECRGGAMSLVGFWNVAVSASVTFIFPWEWSHLGSAGTFLAYGLFALAALVFIVAGIPETRGKSLEELESILVRSPAKTCAGPSPATKRNRPLSIP